MTRSLLFLCVVMLVSRSASAATDSSVTLATSPNPSIFDASVSISATVTPSAATGFVAFYDGVNELGSTPLSGGSAAISTILLSSGKHSLTAYYSGDINYASATSSALSQIVTSTPATTFIAGATLSVGTAPVSVAIADFNGDGNADLAVANNLDNTIGILLGRGDGTFASPIVSTVGALPSQLAVGDFNGDGKPDLAIANGGSNNVTILLGNGDGTFAVAGAFAVGTQPSSLTVADFNGDGIEDLAVANFVSNTINILLGNGDGTFSTDLLPVGVGTGPASVAIGDFNLDGKADLAVANESDNTVSVLLGNGDGTFAPAVSLAVGTKPVSVAIGDFNGDGNADLAVGNMTSNTVSVLLGNGAGAFATAKNYVVEAEPESISVGDFNGDGRTDIAAVNFGSNNLSVLLNDGAGAFATAQNYVVGTGPESIAVGDFNKDGRADLAVANNGSNSVSILLGAEPPASVAASAGTPQSTIINSAFSTPLQATVSDAAGNPLSGVSVTFAAPTSGAGGTFAAGGTTATVQTNASGVVSAPQLTANGVVGAYTVNATVNGLGTPAVFTLTNTPPPLSISTTSFPGGTIGIAYSSIVAAKGGTAPYTWSISSGTATLPSGLSLSATAGTITGTPSGPTGASSFTIQLTDSSSPAQVVAQRFTIAIVSALAITTSALPNGVVGLIYSATLGAQGGLTPYTWSISSNSLPTGLALNLGTGAISGAPTAAAVASFTIMVRDGSGQSVTKQFGITVSPVISLSLPTSDQQPESTITGGQVQAAQAVPVPVSGTVSISFDQSAADLPDPYANPGVCFSSSGCTTPPQTTASFTIPAGSSSLSLPQIQTGTVAGNIVLMLSVPGQPSSTSTLTVPQTTPVIEANSVKILDVTSTGFVVELVAYSSPRDVQTAAFTFDAAAGATITGTATFNVDIASLISQWFSGSQGQSYGSAFSLQVPFGFSGDAGAIQSVTATLTNSVGVSAPVTGTQ